MNLEIVEGSRPSWGRKCGDVTVLGTSFMPKRPRMSFFRLVMPISSIELLSVNPKPLSM